MGFFNGHNHTMYSNLRLLDSIVKPKDLIDKAIKKGLAGIAITEHENLCSHMEINQYAKKIREKYPGFTIALGNEIYLTDTRDKGQKYYHFLLIAKDKIGYRALKELSSIAWYNVYNDRNMERVPLLKSELAEVMQKYKGHIIATSACIGGELSSNALYWTLCEEVNDIESAASFKEKADNFIEYCIKVFGKKDFYIECAPADNEDQIKVNKALLRLAREHNIKMTTASDTHYIEREDRFIHKAYLTSKNGEREVDSFYEFSRLMEEKEVRELLSLSFSPEIIDIILDNTIEIKNKIEFYDLETHQEIPEVEVKDYPKSLDWFGNNNDLRDELDSNWKTLKSLFLSDNVQERYWVNQCFEGLIDKGIGLNPEYIDRLEEEARVKRIISEKLNTCMFAYPNTLQHYINLFWDCGSTVGAGRGSSCAALNHYLLGITQLDPLEWDLPFYRYLNEDRIELGDIDLDLAPSKLQQIFAEIRKERGELGIVQVCTFGTEGTKSTILTACRGYRSEDYPNGIDNDEALYISSLVPQERGFLYSLKDLTEGNPEKGRKPSTLFINTVKQYPGLLEIMKGIESLVCRRGIHASGVILFDENIYDQCAIMKAPNGALVTQWDLHNLEKAGCVKYDFLLTAVQDIIIQTIKLLQEDGVIKKDLSLREVYNKYLHPAVLPKDDKKMWDALANGSVINCFQFDSSVGAQAAKRIKPRSPLEMANANGLMRLIGEPGSESPMDKYVRFKNNIQLWYKEMREAGLTIEEQKTLEPYFLPSYGVPPSQEQMMQMLMDKDICGFSLGEANGARKIVGKKLMDKIPELHEKVLKQAKSKTLGDYVWKYGIGPQMGYSFSKIHALAYSFVGMQTLYLATHFNPIYWNTACLIVNSGSLEENDATDYAKIAKAIGSIRSANIKVSLADINNSDFGFRPDVENNQILFGLKGLLNVGDDVVKLIIENRPYASIKDFCRKVPINRQAMISLIKGGAFDSMHDRKFAMAWYLWNTCDKKKRITLQNMSSLISKELIPEDEEYKLPLRVYEFNRYLKAICKIDKNYYRVDERAMQFLIDINCESLVGPNFILGAKTWDKVYQSYMDTFRAWIGKNHDQILRSLNEIIFKEDWDKYAKKGNLSSWEMEVLCFYFHDHELKNINSGKYGIVDFFGLPQTPIVDKTFKKGNKIINMYKIFKICGTCIAKDKIKSSITLLTPTGVVEVKFRKEYFSLFDKQISQRQPNGTKKVMEKSWFNRGSMLMIQGIRNEDTFISKKYSSTPGHTLYKIDSIDDKGDIVLRSERYKGDDDIYEEV